MITVAQATAVIADQCSAAQVEQGVAYAEDVGYADAEEFFSLAMAAILYNASDLVNGTFVIPAADMLVLKNIQY